MCNISPNMTKFMDNQPLKDMQDFKPCNISNTAYKETNEESTSELNICIVLGVFRGIIYSMYGGMNDFMKFLSS